jgi:hypothetical protein
MPSPLIAAELRARGHDALAIKERDDWQSLSATGKIVAALEARLAEYPGDDDLAKGGTWI